MNNICASSHEIVKQAYAGSLKIHAGCEARLAGVLRDTLAHPGSLTRAHLAYQILHRHPGTHKAALPLATGIEYFHTASLLLDDLPCMDDAFTRRGQICPHRVYGEAACILAALTFINRAYGLVWQAVADLPRDRQKAALSLLEHCLGLAGLINGQSLDIHFDEGPQDEQAVAAIARGKTVALIRLTMVVPALLVGISGSELECLEELSQRWGAAYQLLDDLKDVLHDTEAAKTSGRDQLLGRPNMALCVGLEQAWLRLDELLVEAQQMLTALSEIPRNWSFLNGLQQRLEHERSRLQSLALAA